MLSATEAFEKLRDGNRRFVNEQSVAHANISAASRQALIEGQAPFVVVLGCSDSRVPVELVFDQALGDLFVIRVAGNVAGPIQVGSIEYAVQVLGVRLVVVLGHEQCGAVQATLATIDQPPADLSPGLSAIVQAISPAVQQVIEESARSENILDLAVRANVQAVVNELHRSSTAIKHCIEAEGLIVRGAIYRLSSGSVDFL